MYVKFIGTIFLNMLKCVIIPLIIPSLISAIGNMSVLQLLTDLLRFDGPLPVGAGGAEGHCVLPLHHGVGGRAGDSAGSFHPARDREQCGTGHGSSGREGILHLHSDDLKTLLHFLECYFALIIYVYASRLA